MEDDINLQFLYNLIPFAQFKMLLWYDSTQFQYQILPLTLSRFIPIEGAPNVIIYDLHGLDMVLEPSYPSKP